MTKRMLVDATHDEETRVAVVDGGRLVEFDYESKVRKPLKGSIFLAKVTRVEPSLQAAFVNFGGNRHGFLPFSEIHPDYFRIPVADREALIEAQKAELEQHDEEFEDDDDIIDDPESGKDEPEDAPRDDQDEDEEAVVEVGGSDQPADDDEDDDSNEPNGNIKDDGADDADDNNAATEDSDDDRGRNRNNRGRGRGRQQRGRRSNARGRRHEKYGDSDKPFRYSLRRQYKIQEVIKRGQIMLVQVSKEERGNKGAAVTSYLSLPGRYCVLMPNSPRGGGVSRKIASFKDRRRMREILKEINIPDGMSVILRTAGVTRTKTEIKRDLDYLMRLWDNIRELTLKSTAPALVYEEANLIKRAIRDLYTPEIDEVLVAGDEGYKATKDFMKMMIPSHAKRVKEYKDNRVPLFHAQKVENQITEIGEANVTLKSGGYLVINPTEAMISVDVNSGRATKERHIEETALKTNLEAAEEVARQLRLRDLGGLVVIDFIDMEDRRNNRKVENRLRDALSIDRARIQVGRISSFGLLELSRQRLNPSLTETQFKICPHCSGAGHVRTLDGSVIIAMRALEEEGIKGGATKIILNVPNDMAVYLLNNKRKMLVDIEQRHNLKVEVTVDDTLAPAGYNLDIIKGKKSDEEDADGDDDDSAAKPEQDSAEDDNKNKKGGRRRGRRGGRRRGGRADNKEDSQKEEQAKDEKPADKDDAPKDEKPKRGRTKKADANTEDGNEADKKPAKKTPVKKDDDKKPAKKTPVKKDDDKKTAKKPVEKADDKAEKKPAKTAKSSPSNDTKPAAEGEPSKPKDYETVNKAPEKKKRGWWNKKAE